MSKRKMSLKQACEMVPDDLPDGAYWAMAHDIAGADYGESWDELDGEFSEEEMEEKPEKTHLCPVCRKGFTRDDRMRQHHAAAHVPNEKVKCTHPNCNKQFKQKEYMLDHFEASHTAKGKV